MNKTILSLTHDLKPLFNVTWFLSWLILLVACTSQSVSPTDVPAAPIPETEIAPVTVEANPTATATREPTATATATASLTPTATATPTAARPTATPTETVTPLPTATLTVEELRQRAQIIDAQVEAIMASNNGCQLPCWWGIEPGDTVADAWQIFDMVDENGWVDSPAQRGELEEIGYFRHRYRDEMGEMIHAGISTFLIAQDNRVAVINTYAGRSVDFAAGTAEYNQIGERLVRDWEQFSIRSMFEQFGEPDLIYLLPRNFADGDNFFYEVNIYYLDRGIVVSYSSDLQVNNQGERTICLDTFNMNSVRLWLYDPLTELPPGYLRATYSLWPLSSDLKPEDAYLVELGDLESRTGLAIDEFVTLVLDHESDAACFTLK